MKLTDKAKTDFEYYIYSNDKVSSTTNDYGWNIESFYELTPTFQNALIIEWFDSTWIYVNVLRYDDKWKMIVEGQFRYIFDSRQEALNEAISKANELYNRE